MAKYQVGITRCSSSSSSSSSSREKHMITTKKIEYVIDSGRILSIRYTMTLFGDNYFALEYTCPFEEELHYKHIEGSKEDIRITQEPIPSEEALWEEAEISIYLPHEERDLVIPLFTHDYKNLVFWMSSNHEKT